MDREEKEGREEETEEEREMQRYCFTIGNGSELQCVSRPLLKANSASNLLNREEGRNNLKDLSYGFCHDLDA